MLTKSCIVPLCKYCDLHVKDMVDGVFGGLSGTCKRFEGNWLVTDDYVCSAHEKCSDTNITGTM